MPNPFLVIGAVAVAVATATVGVLAVPGWVESAQDASAQSDLGQIAVLESASLLISNAYTGSISDLKEGRAGEHDLGMKFQPSAGVVSSVYLTDGGRAWCAIAQSESGTFFARGDGDVRIGRGATADIAVAGADCAPEFESPGPPEEDAPPLEEEPGVVEPDPIPTPSPTAPEPTPTSSEPPPATGPVYDGILSDVITAGADTVILDIDWQIPSADPTERTCAAVTITGASASVRPWSLNIDYQRAPWLGQSYFYYTGSAQALFQVGTDRVTVTGSGTVGQWDAAWSNLGLSTSRVITPVLCGHPTTGTPSPQADPSWYDTSTTRGATWEPTRACTVLIVQGKVDQSHYPFFYGWTAEVDLTAAKARITSSGKTVNYVSFTPDPQSGRAFVPTPSANSPVPDTVRLTSAVVSALRGSEQVTIEACVHGY